MKSYSKDLAAFVAPWISDARQHALWLNTLSYLENCGAKAIAAFEHPTLVRREVLKHAAEEFRHAYYLKAQIAKVYPPGFADYCLPNLLGGYASYHYLHRLNVSVSRYLIRDCALQGGDLKEAAYILVTYAIECRAQELYGTYQKLLRQAGSPVSMMGIIREEEGHLAEMQEQLEQMPHGLKRAAVATALESDLCANWVAAFC